MVRAADEAPSAPPPRSRLAVVRLLRPKQWAKNLLVFAAPAAAGVLDNGEELSKSLVAFVAFCLAASGTYCLNDARDAEADRQHPTKRHRPVASGHVGEGLARQLGVVLLAAGGAVTLLVDNLWLFASVAGYVVMMTAYTHGLKRVAVVDLAVVASGFIVRALAGAAATEVPVSDWFLIVTSFGSLFMVAGKRSSEFEEADDPGAHREVLGEYSLDFLHMVRSVSAGVTLLAYTLFAFERADLADATVPWFELSIVPFVLAILRYALRADQGGGSAPEEIVLGDRPLQVLGALWLALFALGVYV